MLFVAKTEQYQETNKIRATNIHGGYPSQYVNREPSGYIKPTEAGIVFLNIIFKILAKFKKSLLTQ